MLMLPSISSSLAACFSGVGGASSGWGPSLDVRTCLMKTVAEADEDEEDPDGSAERCSHMHVATECPPAEKPQRPHGAVVIANTVQL